MVSLLPVLLLVIGAAAMDSPPDERQCPGGPPTTNFSDFYLPDLLVANDGRRITTAAGWAARRQEIKHLLQVHMFGMLPTTVPTVVGARLIQNFSTHGIRDELWEVDFAEAGKTVALDIEVILPVSATPAHPLPLFVSEETHRSWAMRGVSRGYAAMLTPTNDANDATGFKTLYPNATWGDIIRRAWTASRCLDWVLNAKFNPHAATIDPSSISFAGHSRNGKQAELVGAFDERFGAIVGSSPSTPTQISWRFASAWTFGPAPGHDPSTWYTGDGVHGMCYEGYEDRNPIDAHGVLALIAPRALLMAGAMLDGCGSVFAAEQTFKAALPAFELLNATQQLRATYRPDQHIGWIQPELYFDWFDLAFSRGGGLLSKERSFPVKLMYNFSWVQWSGSLSPEALKRASNPPPASADKRTRLLWGLGESPAERVWSPGYGEGPPGAMNYESYKEDYVDTGILTHDRWSLPTVERQVVA